MIGKAGRTSRWGGLGFTYPRRQQYRRLWHAARAASGCAAAALLAMAAASAGAMSIALVLFVVAFGLGFSALQWRRLAERSRVGARSEREVRLRLARFEREGWRLRHSLAWRGRGDVDSVAIARNGVAFVTKTRSYDERHLAVVREQAAWLWHRRRRWCSQGVLPVLCMVRERGVHRCEQGVLVVSIDQLLPWLRETVASGSQMV
jgi:hypothetical protein